MTLPIARSRPPRGQVRTSTSRYVRGADVEDRNALRSQAWASGRQRWDW